MVQIKTPIAHRVSVKTLKCQPTPCRHLTPSNSVVTFLLGRNLNHLFWQPRIFATGICQPDQGVPTVSCAAIFRWPNKSNTRCCTTPLGNLILTLFG